MKRHEHDKESLSEFVIVVNFSLFCSFWLKKGMFLLVFSVSLQTCCHLAFREPLFQAVLKLQNPVNGASIRQTLQRCRKNVTTRLLVLRSSGHCLVLFPMFSLQNCGIYMVFIILCIFLWYFSCHFLNHGHFFRPLQEILGIGASERHQNISHRPKAQIWKTQGNKETRHKDLELLYSTDLCVSTLIPLVPLV